MIFGAVVEKAAGKAYEKYDPNAGPLITLKGDKSGLQFSTTQLGEFAPAAPAALQLMEAISVGHAKLVEISEILQSSD